jgi:hypothetical protein
MEVEGADCRLHPVDCRTELGRKELIRSNEIWQQICAARHCAKKPTAM